MNVFLRTILISMLLLVSPLRDAMAGVGCCVGGEHVTLAEERPAHCEIFANHAADPTGGMAGDESADSPEEADEAVIEGDRHASWAGPESPARSIEDSGPQCAKAQATPPPDSF